MLGDVGLTANFALIASELVIPLIATVLPELIAKACASDELLLSRAKLLENQTINIKDSIDVNQVNKNQTQTNQLMEKLMEIIQVTQTSITNNNNIKVYHYGNTRRA